MSKNIIVSLVSMIMLSLNAVPVRAAGLGQNFIGEFLNRYRSTPVSIPVTPAEQNQQALASLIQSGVLPLTVGDLIGLTLNNNLDISVNRLTPFSSLLAIESFYRPFEPTIRLAASVTRNTTPAASQLVGAQSLASLTHNYTVGFGQTLATGTNVGVDLVMNRASSNSSFNTFNPSWNGTVRYSISQNFLRDFGRAINTRQIRIAQNNQKISEAQFETQVIDLVSQAQKTYWDLVFTAEDLKVKQRSMDLAQKTLSDNRTQVEIGTLAPIDVVQAESEVATRQEQLVISTYTQTQVEDQVKKLISPQLDPGMVLARVNPLQAVRRPAAGDVMTVEDAIKVAFENRPELRRLDLDLENRAIEVEYAKNQLLPVLTVSGAYNHTGLGGREIVRASNGGPVVAVLPGGLGDAFGQLFGYDFRGYSIGFNLQIPLRNRAAQGEHARALTEQQLAQSRLNATMQAIALEVRNAITQVEMNRARIDAAEKARELTERRLDAEQKKFELGASTIRFVLEEQRNVTQAQTNEINALVNYTKALVDYDRSIGMTLQKNNIEIEKTLNPAVASNASRFAMAQ
jgi:outer membrane protein TolC